MQCQRCGATLPEGAKRCTTCDAAGKAPLSSRDIKRIVCNSLTLLMALGAQACLFLPWLTIDEAVVIPLRLGEATGLGEALQLGFTILAIMIQVTLAFVLLFAVLSFFVKHPRLTLLSRLPGVVLISLCAGVTVFSPVIGLLSTTTVLSFFELQTAITTHSAVYVTLIFAIGTQITTTLWRDNVE